MTPSNFSTAPEDNHKGANSGILSAGKNDSQQLQQFSKSQTIDNLLIGYRVDIEAMEIDSGLISVIDEVSRFNRRLVDGAAAVA